MTKTMARALAIGLLAAAAMSARGQDDGTKDLLFYASFDGSADATYGKGPTAPLAVKEAQFVPGIKGLAVRVPPKGALAYATQGNLNRDRGTVSFWMQRPVLSEEEEKSLREKWRARYLFGGRSKNKSMVNLRLGGADSLVMELAGEKMGSSIYASWAAGTWHHVAAAWDKDSGMCLYLDGQFLPCGNETLGGLRRQCSFEPDAVAEMHVGCLGESGQSDLAIDELKIHGRVLSGDEIRRIVREASPLYCRVLPQVLASGANKLTLRLVNQGKGEVKGRAHWEALDPAQARVAQGEIGPLALAPGAAQEFPLEVTAAAPGQYTLALDFEAENGRRRTFPLYLLEPARLGKLERNPNPTLEPVDQIDCGQPLPPERFMQRGESRIVKSPLGDYCEAAPEKWSRLVYTINVQAVQEPHLLTIRYPDDKPRCAYVMARCAEKRNNYALDAGYSVGAEFPNTGELQTARYLWWPMEQRNAVMLASWWADQPAAVKDIKVERIVGGVAAVPRLEVSEPRDEPGRMLAIEWEDASLAGNFGFDLDPTLTMGRFAELTDRLIAYMGFTGMNTLVYPATFYFGPMCRYPETTGLGSRLELHPEGWLEILMARFSQAGLVCYPSLNFHSTPVLVESNVDDPIRIVAGADTFFQVPYDGVVPRFRRGDSTLNPLHPKVQQQTIEIIEGIVSRCENYPAYHGIELCFWPYRQIPFCFLDIRHGYEDATVGQFEKDTGIKIPVSPTDPDRFYKRYRFLLETHRADWVDWRCRKIADYVAQIAAIARRKNKDARILIPLLQEAWPDEIALYRKLFFGRSTCETQWRERGVDIKRLAQIPGVHIQRQTRDAYRRYLHEKEAKSSRDNASSWEVSKPFRETPSGAFPFNHYYEHRWTDSPVPGGWWRDEWSAGTANGGGRYYLERSAWSVFLQDAQSLCRGACSVEAQASIWEFREFARAYRALPEKPFEAWTQTAIEPAAVRQCEGKAGRYFYAVNSMYCPLDLTVKLSPPGPVTDLSDNTQLAPTDGALAIKLKPYELRSFLAAPGAVVSDVRLAPPERLLADLRERLANLRKKLETDPGSFLEEDRAAHGKLVADIAGRLDAGRICQAWRLLESEQADRMLAPPPADRKPVAPAQASAGVPEIGRNLCAGGDFDPPAATAPGATAQEILKAAGIADGSIGTAKYLNKGRKEGQIAAARVELVPGKGRNGSSCLMVDAAQNACFSLSMPIAQEVVPGYDYSLSLWLRSDRARVVPFVLSVSHEGGKRWNYCLSVGLDEQWRQCRVVLSVPRRFPGDPPAGNSLILALKNAGEKGEVRPATFFVDDVALTCLGKDLSD